MVLHRPERAGEASFGKDPGLGDLQLADARRVALLASPLTAHDATDTMA